MARPKSSEKAKRQKGSITTNGVYESTEYSQYLGLKYDYDAGRLVGYRLEKFIELRKKYE